eukprot:986181-Alexandrium_andersonii.AAC.1
MPPVDMRKHNLIRKSSKHSDAVDRFFQHVYAHEAEALPDIPDVHKEDWSSDDEEGLPKNTDEPLTEPRPMGPDIEEPFVSPVASENPRHASGTLPVRYIASQTLSFLYQHFVAFCRSADCADASPSTFWRGYRKRWVVGDP